MANDRFICRGLSNDKADYIANEINDLFLGGYKKSSLTTCLLTCGNDQADSISIFG